MHTEQARWPTYTVPPLAGKVAIVTGGAKGIGGAISSVLACDGADVVVAGRDVAALEEHVASLASSFPEAGAAAMTCDVTDVVQVEGLIAGTVERFGGLDILVNAAGITGPIETPAQDVDPDAFRNVLEVNVDRYVPALPRSDPPVDRARGRWADRQHRRHVGSAWLPQPDRVLELEMGVAGPDPHARVGARSSRHHGQHDLSERHERRPGCRRSFARRRRRRAAPSRRSTTTSPRRPPSGRFVDDTDVANALRYLVSEGARNVTGHDIPVDAGWDV